MKPTYLLFGICLVFCFTACKPDFDLNGPYKDITIVYGILNYEDSIHYVKIYKGFQSHKKGGVFVDAQNPDSIYYYDHKTQTSLITVVLQEFNKEKRTPRKDIPLEPLYIKNIPEKEFPDGREPGFFYSGDKSIIYRTKETLSKNYSYKIVIKHNITGKITEGITPILGNGTDGNHFEVYKLSPTSMLNGKASVTFYAAEHAEDYEFHVNFLYFEVNNNTKEVTNHKIVKNICPTVGEKWNLTPSGYFLKEFSKTFYDDIAKQVKPNPDVTRYMGYLGEDGKPSNGSCIEVEGWAAGESVIKYLLSNQPTSSFIQINTIYTNLTSSEGLAFGFFSSQAKTPVRTFTSDAASQDTLIMGYKTYRLGFRPWTEYKP